LLTYNNTLFSSTVYIETYLIHYIIINCLHSNISKCQQTSNNQN